MIKSHTSACFMCVTTVRSAGYCICMSLQLWHKDILGRSCCCWWKCQSDIDQSMLLKRGNKAHHVIGFMVEARPDRLYWYSATGDLLKVTCHTLFTCIMFLQLYFMTCLWCIKILETGSSRKQTLYMNFDTISVALLWLF